VDVMDISVPATVYTERVVCGIRDNLVTRTATVLIDQTKG